MTVQLNPHSSGVNRFLYWVHEREAIRVKKEAQRLPAPWTNDEILRKFRFCNVRRCDDRVSRWIIEHVIAPARSSPSLWIQLALARYINWPPTIRALRDAALWPKPTRKGWAPIDWTAIGNFLDARKEKVWTGAYMIRAESNPNAKWYSWGKGRYVAEIVIGGLWAKSSWIVPQLTSVERAHEALMTAGYGMGSFMAGQVVADLTYTPVLANAPDLYSYAPLGPGSRRGLNRLLKRPLTASISQPDANALFIVLNDLIRKEVPRFKLTLHDVQNCCCEFDKYERVLNGEGRPRSLYSPTKEF